MATLEKTGMDNGLKAVHPITGAEVPVWAANFVLMEYGAGAVMAVPAHDQRDYEFAQKNDIPIVQVIHPAGDDQSADLSQAAFTAIPFRSEPDEAAVAEDHQTRPGAPRSPVANHPPLRRGQRSGEAVARRQAAGQLFALLVGVGGQRHQLEPRPGGRGARFHYPGAALRQRGTVW